MENKSENMDYITMGKRIKDIRKKKGITQERLAEITGLSSAHISNIETAHTKASLSSVVSIANALKVSLDEILQESLETAVSMGVPSDVLSECTLKEARIINETITALKNTLIKNRKKA